MSATTAATWRPDAEMGMPSATMASPSQQPQQRHHTHHQFNQFTPTRGPTGILTPPSPARSVSPTMSYGYTPPSPARSVSSAMSYGYSAQEAADMMLAEQANPPADPMLGRYLAEGLGVERHEIAMEAMITIGVTQLNQLTVLSFSEKEELLDILKVLAHVLLRVYLATLYPAPWPHSVTRKLANTHGNTQGVQNAAYCPLSLYTPCTHTHSTPK